MRREWVERRVTRGYLEIEEGEKGPVSVSVH